MFRLLVKDVSFFSFIKKLHKSSFHMTQIVPGIHLANCLHSMVLWLRCGVQALTAVNYVQVAHFAESFLSD